MSRGRPRKEDALRRNPEHKRKKLVEWRASHPEQYVATRRRNEKSRAERYQANPAFYLWRTARIRAAKKGIEFAISPEDVVVPEVCPITGVSITPFSAAPNNGASLDRVDNSKGYVKGNIRVISRRANRMKSDASLADMERILAYMRGEI